MFKSYVKFLAIALIGVIVSIAPASARSGSADTGLSVIHIQERVGNRICYSYHLHHSAGTGPTKRAALKAAVKRWNDFTAWEYGNAWGRFSRAVGRTSHCQRRADRSYYCSIKGRACRPARGYKSRKTARRHR